MVTFLWTFSDPLLRFEGHGIFRRLISLNVSRGLSAIAEFLVWFTDEKLFTVEPPVNLQNDRVYAATGTRKNKISARLLRTRSTFLKSVMVSIGVFGARIH